MAKRQRRLNINNIKKTFSDELDEYIKIYKEQTYCHECHNTAYYRHRYFLEDVCFKCNLHLLYKTHLKITYHEIYISMLNELYKEHKWFPSQTKK